MNDTIERFSFQEVINLFRAYKNYENWWIRHNEIMSVAQRLLTYNGTSKTEPNHVKEIKCNYNKKIKGKFRRIPLRKTSKHDRGIYKKSCWATKKALDLDLELEKSWSEITRWKKKEKEKCSIY